MGIGFRRASVLGVAVLAVLAAGCRTVAPFDISQRGPLAESIIAGWSPASRVTAAGLIEGYGPPDAVALGALGWKNRGGWKRIVLWDANESAGAGNLEQTVAYRVPEGRRDALEAFSGRVRVSRDGTELSARSDSEGLNCLALNLADEVGRGVRGPEEARRFYESTVALAAAGKSSRYMQGILFLMRP
jgi:hypothetical protein